jgi:lipoate synthase
MNTAMATITRDKRTTRPQITFQQAIEILSREERFMATVSAMNSLLIQRGIYTAEEFDSLFCSWALAQLERPKEERIGTISSGPFA